LSDLYNFTVTLSDESQISLGEFRGKKILLVNSASYCGFTSQYIDLQQLYQNYQDKIVIIAFPCNQFASQEPDGDSEISAFCQANFDVTFPISQKIKVNGDQASPLFKYVVEQLPGVMGVKYIKWNFTKFLFDEQGAAVKRFAPTTNPKQIAKYL
jgi:glutathione peroxidase